MDIQLFMKECVIVLGMHRSGTSVFSGLVASQGFYLGADEMPSRGDNPKGFFENFQVYKLNQSILLDHNTSWDDYSFTVDQIKPDNLLRYQEQAKELVKSEFGPVKRIFIKDPRMCLLFPLWEKVLQEMGFKIKVIIAYRSPMEVARSLQSRDDIVVEKSLLMWSHHFFQAEKTSRNHPRMLVRYDNDLHDLEDFYESLAKFLDITVTDEMLASAHELYSPKLKHHQLQMDNISHELPIYLKKFILLLQNNVLDKQDQLDEIIEEFYYSKQFYLYDETNLHNKIGALEDELTVVKRQLEAAENEVQFKLKEIHTHKIRIENATNDYSHLEEKFKTTKGKLERTIIKQQDQITTGNEVFEKAFRSPYWNKQLGRIISGEKYFRLKRVTLPLAKRANKKMWSEKALIIESRLFSPFYYLTKNPDVWRAGIDPLNHFCKHGWKEGRNPSPYFNVDKYLKVNNDVAKSGKNPLLHYIKFGKKEGRSPQTDVVMSEIDIAQKKEIMVSDKNCIALKETLNKLSIPDLNLASKNLLVSIIILNRDGLDHLKTLLPALVKHTKGINYEVIIVDNASSDESVFFLESFDLGLNINLTIIKNNKNETFSKANNQAAEIAKGKYLLLLNNDVEPLPGWLHNMLHSIITKDNIGSVGSRLVYPYKQSFQKSCSIQHAGISFRDELGFFRPYNLGNGSLVDSPLSLSSCNKSALTAACLLVSADVYQEVGGLDEEYNYGFEDVDFGLKLTQAGYQNYYCAESVLFHYEFGTQKNNDIDKVAKRRESNANLLRQKWFSKIKDNFWREKLFNKSRLFAESPLKVAIAVTDYGPEVTAGDYFTAQEIAKYLEEFGWTINYLSRLKNEWYQIDNDTDVIISLLDAYDLTKLPKRNTRITTVAWARNWFDRWCDNPCFDDYDMVFASSNKSCEYVRNHSKQEPMLLPIASNTERFNIKPNCKNPEFFKSDICFTGSYWDSPREIMQALSNDALEKYSFNVYGANWEKFDKFKPYNKGFVAYHDMPNVYHHTKIVIDDANHVTKPYGAVNSRVFDALLSGALVITNGVEGSKDLFDAELPYYENSKELDELLGFYLNNEEARLEKVKQLKEIILNDHTYEHRAKSIRGAFEKRFLSKSIAIKIPCPTWEGSYSWGDYHMAVLLKKQFENQGYYVLLQILPEWDNDEGLECDVALVLRGLSRYNPKSHQINLMWNISHPDKVTLEEYEEYDKVFIASELWAEKISKQVSVPVETMLQCTDPDRFYEPTEEEKERYKQQLLFVGNSRDIYRKVLKDLIPTEYDLAVYGKNWKKLIPKQYIKADHISNNELYKHYGSAEILLNDHWDDMREKGFVSNRIFDGLACGAFILTDKVEAMGGLEEFLHTYKTKEDLEQSIEYCLANSVDCRRKAKKGMAFILENHTFKERVEQFSSFIIAQSESRSENIAKLR